MSEIHLFNQDCMIGMKDYPDKYFELAIVDPPYFDRGGDPSYYRSRACQSTCKPITETWNIPGPDYFKELFRVSRRKIIWGVNYYGQYIPHFSRIVWDKVNDGTPFSQADIASFMIQENMKEKELRIHPTQKPVALYKWLLKNYAKPGDKILDTHFGSLSIGIACHDMGFDLWAWELDESYFKAGKERLERHQCQGRLF